MTKPSDSHKNFNEGVRARSKIRRTLVGGDENGQSAESNGGTWIDEVIDQDHKTDKTDTSSNSPNRGTWIEQTVGRTTDKQQTKDTQQINKEESRLVITIAQTKCKECGTHKLRWYHDGCSAPIIRVGKGWQCSGCEASIRLEANCPDCGGSVVAEPTDVPIDLSFSDRLTTVERAIHKETNRRRSKHGVRTLKYSDHLSAIALQHSRDMVQRDFFSHTNPDGAGTADRYRRFGHSTQSAGENIAVEYPEMESSPADAAQSVVNSWMDSKGHRENILRDQFKKEGIGVYLDCGGGMYVTQNFY